MQFVRQSKFRHVFAKPLKREFCLEDVRVTKVSWDSLFCVVNTKFIAIIVEGSGGPFLVLPISKVGRLGKDCPIVDGHKAPCLDIAWNPFNENVIASCSEDCTAKVWRVPERGLVRNLKEPAVELLGHQKRVGIIVWHPSASDILLTAGADLKIFLWKVGTGEALIEIAGHPDIIYSVDFNYNGSKLVTTCKDKQIRIVDPRTGRIVQQGTGHEGLKPQRAIFLKDGRIFSTGFTKRSERVYALRDEEALEEPIIQEELEISNGVLFPFYDPDSNLLYLCGKGDSNIRYYEINNEPPFVHYINVFTTPEPQRGLGFMPKRGLSVTENEIARMYKCTNRGIVEVLQFFVPRKSEQFQSDLYPDTRGPTPALTAEEWMNGRNADPILIPVKPEKLGSVHQARPSVLGSLKSNANLLTDRPPSPPVIHQSVYGRKSIFDQQRSQSPSIMPDVVTISSPSRERAEPVHSLRSKFEQKFIDQQQQQQTDLHNSSAVIGRRRQQPPPIRSISELIMETTQAAEQLKEIGDQQQRYSTPPQRSYAAPLQRNYPEQRNSPVSSGVGKTFVNGMEPNLAFKPPVVIRSKTTGFKPASSGSRDDDLSPLSEVRRNAGFLNSNDKNNNIATQSIDMENLNLTEVLNDIQKLKVVARRHERRIRQLEEQLHEKEMHDLDSL